MAILHVLASFPNSRSKARSATREVEQYKAWAPDTGDAPATVMPTIGSHAPIGTVTANGNIHLVAANADRTYCYIRNTHLSDILYFNKADVANIQDEGNYIKASEAYSIEHLEDVYVRAEALNRIIVQIEEGQG